MKIAYFQDSHTYSKEIFVISLPDLEGQKPDIII